MDSARSLGAETLQQWELLTLPNLFYVSIKLITGSKFRDIFLGDSRHILGS